MTLFPPPRRSLEAVGISYLGAPFRLIFHWKMQSLLFFRWPSHPRIGLSCCLPVAAHEWSTGGACLGVNVWQADREYIMMALTFLKVVASRSAASL
jgi:hypothetical protein